MKWNQHSNLEGSHALFSASGYHWINYDESKMISTFRNKQAVLEGTKLHDFASHCIKMHQKLPRSQKTLNMFVNDAIAYNMKSEQVLYFSDNFFGTTDAISFSREGRKNEKPILRIFDLKTGENPAHMEQLLIYAALFCLEYGIVPGDIEIELRLYQFNDINLFNPTAEDIAPIMDKIKHFDKIIKQIKSEEEY